MNVNRNGFVLNPYDLVVYGAYNKNRLSTLLPVSYEVSDFSLQNQMNRLSPLRYKEKIYVHTDKPYYYPGEQIWFKGYIHYGEAAMRDSLSKVIYAELINPKQEIQYTKTLRIDSGFFYNDFVLQDSLQEGMYYLRAYTNFSINFGEETLFVKPIPILKITDGGIRI
ncbi:MAG: hypothetical protein IPJ20_20855 [Flammeovirgaceae bacterium]|nr:hypothetical protein [Flammeovirgaceae bacterium]